MKSNNSKLPMDNPKIPEFASWQSFDNFSRRVRHGRRYVRGRQDQAFLETVLATLRDRDVKIPVGSVQYRAQMGVEYQPVLDKSGHQISEEPVGFNRARMKPLVDRAKEGRVNASGIPALYLASTEQTAVSEIRPWLGSEVSVAQFKILRDIKAVDLSRGHGQASIGHLTFAQVLGEKPIDSATKEKAVWIDIDNAFSRPIARSDDAADYVPAQILAELFRDAGYDAIIYRSQFGKDGYNVAIFNIDDAEVINCAPFKVTGIEVNFTQIGNHWYSTNDAPWRKPE